MIWSILWDFEKHFLRRLKLARLPLIEELDASIDASVLGSVAQ